MAKRSFPLAKVYGLLEPGPVVLVTTASKGRANIMTMSWHTMMEFEPPLVGCVISGRNASFDTLKATKECVINIPTQDLAKQVVGIGNCSGRTVDKFAKFGFTPVDGVFTFMSPTPTPLPTLPSRAPGSLITLNGLSSKRSCRCNVSPWMAVTR